jgi:hypothetical protein
MRLKKMYRRFIGFPPFQRLPGPHRCHAYRVSVPHECAAADAARASLERVNARIERAFVLISR